ncbi:Bax inhibitor-1/YccA family protein [Planctomicrobium sp. SH661]|uniref:Bax inhibitor-1/YccA family protein n=1 Tax=Planctomicrobium sp. SH661 TaxID=3448124 RepID=UPI003F5B1E30
MRTSNPALNANTFEGFDSYSVGQTSTMSLQGTATKTMALLVLVVGAAVFTWNLFLQGSPLVTPLLIGGSIGGLIIAIATTFKPTWSPITAPLYAVAEGLALGGISAAMNARYPGAAFQAVCLTFGTLFSLLLAYQTGWIKPSQKFKLGIAAATGGIALLYVVMIGLSFFGVKVPFIQGNGWISIGFSAFVVVIAAMNLILDFDFIEEGVQRGAPKYMEWYGAFGLLVTLVWLYIEILRLLSKIRSRD